jgi:hypothetical protein
MDLPPCSIDDSGIGALFSTFFTFYNLFLGAAASVAVLMLIIGGLKFMMGGSDEMVKSGKSTIFNAIAGLALILLAYLIINTLLTLLGVRQSGNACFIQYLKSIGL